MKSDIKQIVILIISFAVGIVAFLLTHLYIKSEQAKLDQLRKHIEAGTEKVKVLVADRPIPRGSTIQKSDIAQKNVPKS